MDTAEHYKSYSANRRFSESYYKTRGMQFQTVKRIVILAASWCMVSQLVHLSNEQRKHPDTPLHETISMTRSQHRQTIQNRSFLFPLSEWVATL